MDGWMGTLPYERSAAAEGGWVPWVMYHRKKWEWEWGVGCQLRGFDFDFDFDSIKTMHKVGREGLTKCGELYLIFYFFFLSRVDVRGTYNVLYMV